MKLVFIFVNFTNNFFKSFFAVDFVVQMHGSLCTKAKKTKKLRNLLENDTTGNTKF